MTLFEGCKYLAILFTCFPTLLIFLKKKACIAYCNCISTACKYHENAEKGIPTSHEIEISKTEFNEIITGSSKPFGSPDFETLFNEVQDR